MQLITPRYCTAVALALCALLVKAPGAASAAPTAPADAPATRPSTLPATRPGDVPLRPYPQQRSEIERPLDFKVTSIDGEERDLRAYEGYVVLLVNVASKCGLTPQYSG